MKLSDYIIQFLSEQGVTCIFGYPGGAVTHLIDSIHKRADIGFISTYHEQGAAFSAEGYARITNGIGVALATSGPGATNLITGIGSAFFDSIPCLYITGQVNTYEYKGDLRIRQLGFQETDIVSIVKPITKYAVQLTEPERIKYELQKAVYIATGGRKGPVLLDIPMDIQRADIQVEALESYKAGPTIYGGQEYLQDILKVINNSRRPVILAGGGVRLAGAAEELNKFAGHTGIPVVCSLMGLDACVGSMSNCCGLIGSYGNRYGNYTLANSDLVLVLGSRLDTRQTGTRPENFARGAKIVRVDIDRNELEKSIKPDEISLELDVLEFLKALNATTARLQMQDIGPWLARVKAYKEKYPSFNGKAGMDPNDIMYRISQYTKENDILCLDVGQNQMWAAQSMELKEGQRLVISGGMGSMGFALPAAIGAYYARPDVNIIAITGDGGLQMNIQELQLLKRNKIPVKIIVMNNNCLGMIRHFQEMYFDSRYAGTILGYEAPDFCRIAEAYGIRNTRIDVPEQLPDIEKYLGENEPVVVDIRLERMTYVLPKLAVNKPIEDQEPLLGRDEFRDNMIVEPLEE